MSSRYTTSCQRQTKPARSGDILSRRNQRSSVQLCRPKNWCSHFSGSVKAQSRNITCPGEPLSTVNHPVFCVRTTWNLHPYQNTGLLSSGVLLPHNTPPHTLLQHFRKLRICLWSVFHILYICIFTRPRTMCLSYVWTPQRSAECEEVLIFIVGKCMTLKIYGVKQIGPDSFKIPSTHRNSGNLSYSCSSFL